MALGAVAVLLLGAAAVYALVLSPKSGAPSPTLSTTASPTTVPSESSRASDSAPPSTEPSSGAPTATPTTVPSTATQKPPTPAPTLGVPSQPATISFYAVRDGQVDLFTVPPEGGEIVNLTMDAPADSDPKWSPDGTRLVFDSRRVDGQRNIWVLEPDGSFTPLTQDSGAINSFATWSPDGSEIAWSHDGQIWVMNASDGSDGRALTSGQNDNRPSWSMNGEIAFHRTTGGALEIWTATADGSSPEERRIAASAGGGRQPSWSPDGSRLAYTRNDRGVLRIYVANADGSSRTSLTQGALCPCQYPTWSPDGTAIAFQAGATKTEQIYVISASGGTPTRVTDGTGQNLTPGWGT